MIDATVVRAHHQAAGAAGSSEADEALGRSVGGFSTKVHVKIDALGMPLAFQLTPGQRSEIKVAPDLVGDDLCDALLADRGYDSDDFREVLARKDIEPVIPGRCNRIEAIVYDEEIYKERNHVERYINKLKHWRGIATRYAKRAITFLANLTLHAIISWLRI